MKLNFIQPTIDVISSYKNFNNETVFFDGPLSEQYIYIKTNKDGFNKIKLIAEECVDGVQFLCVPGSLNIDYVVAIPYSIIAYLSSEALSYDMLMYLDSEGYGEFFPNVFYNIVFGTCNVQFDRDLLNEHTMMDKTFIEQRLDDIQYDIYNAEDLCAINPLFKIYTHLMALRITSTENAVRKLIAVWESNDLVDVLSAKTFIKPYSCFISDYFARDYALVKPDVMDEVFDDWCNLIQSQYNLVEKASGEMVENDLRIYPPTHAVQTTVIVNLSLMMNYIKYALDDKNHVDYFTVAIAHEMVQILKIHNDIPEVKDFFEKYIYGIFHMEHRVEAYKQMYNEKTNT